MSKKHKWTLLSILFISSILMIYLLIAGSDGALLNPKGIIASKQKNLLIVSTLLMLIVVVPVLVITCVFAWRYRVENLRAKYDPTWSHNSIAEAIWWGLPFLIIIVLSVIVWKSSHELDPYKPLDTEKTPLKIQVIALDWKWLFIYPEHQIAAVNFMQFPKDTPLEFSITADAPMNSFWIPQLGGQIYAMPGMISHLHLMADEEGDYRGSSANLSGKGFANMVFTAKCSSEEAFHEWVKQVQNGGTLLTNTVYQQLAKQSENDPVTFYQLDNINLFHEIMMHFMEPKP